MPYNRKHLTPGEEIVREFRSHWRLLVFPLFWALLGTALAIATWPAPPDQVIFDWVVTGIAIAAALWWGLRPFINWWFRYYVLTTERLITRSGVIARKGVEMPLENINDIRFNQNILERILRSGDLVIESAGEQGQSRFTDIPDPESFQSLLYRTREDRAVVMASDASQDPAAQLEALKRLYDQGAVTDEEYEQKRRRLLDRM